MSKELRVYVAVQDGCAACEVTKATLRMDKKNPTIAGVPIYEVNLSSNTTMERRRKMGVTATPTVFLVEAEDTDGDGIASELEEKHIYHQSGVMLKKGNLKAIIKAYQEGGIIRTNV